MALPSALTAGSVVFVLGAGVGLAAMSADAVRDAGPSNGTPPAEAPRRSADHTQAEHPATAPAPTLSKRKAPRSDPDAVPGVLVEVYNNSGITGLAAQKASMLQNAGWNVAATDNWYGDIPVSTVYYPPQLLDEARQLAEVLGVARVQPAVAPMQFDRLTVIFTSG